MCIGNSSQPGPVLPCVQVLQVLRVLFWRRQPRSTTFRAVNRPPAAANRSRLRQNPTNLPPRSAFDRGNPLARVHPEQMPTAMLPHSTRFLQRCSWSEPDAALCAICHGQRREELSVQLGKCYQRLQDESWDRCSFAARIVTDCLSYTSVALEQITAAIGAVAHGGGC
uniref:(northern house mosquito) hypothetical protein n=1 Tax=Culex pipiens TaxID=7175 RepID=A0A8D8JSL8_CULPI